MGSVEGLLQISRVCAGVVDALGGGVQELVVRAQAAVVGSTAAVEVGVLNTRKSTSRIVSLHQDTSPVVLGGSSLDASGGEDGENSDGETHDDVLASELEVGSTTKNEESAGCKEIGRAHV